MKFKPMFGEYQFLYILIVIDIGPFEKFHKNLILVLDLSKTSIQTWYSYWIFEKLLYQLACGIKV
jgi:hypothetical protein